MRHHTRMQHSGKLSLRPQPCRPPSRRVTFIVNSRQPADAASMRGSCCVRRLLRTAVNPPLQLIPSVGSSTSRRWGGAQAFLSCLEKGAGGVGSRQRCARLALLLHGSAAAAGSATHSCRSCCCRCHCCHRACRPSWFKAASGIPQKLLFVSLQLSKGLQHKKRLKSAINQANSWSAAEGACLLAADQRKADRFGCPE